MKTRQGFVSNSSSASFILKKSMVTVEQLEKVCNHSIEGEKLGLMYAKSDPWDITEDDENLYGYTSMTNFDMEKFFDKIGIKNAYIIEGDY
jgi:hypothetical protein